jgi:hypothetical protein
MVVAKYQLVLQWPAASVDFDRLIEIEDAVASRLQGSEVDGHDYGAGEANLFILTQDPPRTFHSIKDVLEQQDALCELRAAFRRVDQSDYVVLWPTNLTEFKIS